MIFSVLCSKLTGAYCRCALHGSRTPPYRAGPAATRWRGHAVAPFMLRYAPACVPVNESPVRWLAAQGPTPHTRSTVMWVM